MGNSQTIPRVAVVILSWNGKKFLAQFLPSVVKTTYQNVEIIVADNASTDDTVAFMEQHYPTIRLIKLTTNSGFAGGYNNALAQVESDYYVLLNQDVEVTPNWIEPVIEAMEANETIVAAQPKIRAFHQKELFEYAGAAGGYIDTFGYTFCRGRIFSDLEKDTDQYNTFSNIFWATGACLFIKSQTYHELGGLEADLFAHMEEIDLCWRILNRKKEIIYCPNSIVYHVGGGSLPQGNPKKTYLNFRNNLFIMVRNLPKGTLYRTIFIRLLLDHIAAYLALLNGQWRDFLAIAKAHRHFIWNFRTWQKRRKKNMLLTSSEFKNLPGVYRNKIIVDYFLKGKKRFSDLVF